MKKVLICLADGFEEIEATGTIDVLRRAGIEVKVASVTGSQTVTGAHHIRVQADQLIGETDFSGTDMIVLPGGMPGAQHLKEHKLLREKLTAFNKDGKLLGAICAAPMVLGDLGILDHKKATCFPGFESKLGNADFIPAPVVEDQNIITGRGPGLVFEFALKLVEKLSGKVKAEDVADQMLL